MENAKKKKEGPPFSGLHASRKVVSHRLCPQVPLLGRAYSARQSEGCDLGDEAGIEGTQKVGAELVYTFVGDQVQCHSVHQEVLHRKRCLHLLEHQAERLILVVQVPSLAQCVCAGLE
jgi:hypothetical protein